METIILQKEQKISSKKNNTPFFKPIIQKKLSVGSANDSYEVEADRVADKVMKMSEPSPQVVTHTGSLVQRKCAACEQDEKLQMKPLSESITPLIQRSSLENAGESNAPSHIESKINSSRGNGNIMDDGTKNFMENRFGTDFSNVKIHTGNEAVQMSRELNAQAFAVGNDIYFNEGKYNPTSDSGKHLLAHELTHTLQQRNLIMQKDDDKNTLDPETEMGKKIITSAPDGLKIGIYDHNEGEMKRKSNDWALVENAIGFEGVKPSIKLTNLVFGKAISDENDSGKTINAISTIAKTCVDKANKLSGVTSGDQYKIKTLAFFAHGTEGWCSITPISGNEGKKLVKNIAGSLKNDVNIIIYACSVANSPSATHDDWDKGTMDAGGKDSMAAGVRDELFDQKITSGKVWGHTTVGHVTTNFALRYFKSDAKGTEGLSYVSEHVFTSYDEYLIRQEVIKQLTTDGFDSTVIDVAKLTSYQFKNLRKYFYRCYAQANDKLKYNERNLAEATPNHPIEVAKIINNYWETNYWPKIKTLYIAGIVKHFKLIKATK
ncbi:DUF4157 domain-containing protein [Chryseobacterium aahli]|uniref:eCIS core domain-containing protein n=1 Tax=Chryseobacterium aahli TaxID=1278643 RepID=UPI001F61E975|nr:DUF4157 domain-containing protein [Chryseobacterium aahli]MCI3939202.1 DUF4157 domain-containing protein [Chryseobacterium aahli]